MIGVFDGDQLAGRDQSSDILCGLLVLEPIRDCRVIANDSSSSSWNGFTPQDVREGFATCRCRGVAPWPPAAVSQYHSIPSDNAFPNFPVRASRTGTRVRLPNRLA
jgi:hypothetical protein